MRRPVGIAASGYRRLDPLRDRFALSGDSAVNDILFATRGLSSSSNLNWSQPLQGTTGAELRMPERMEWWGGLAVGMSPSGFCLQAVFGEKGRPGRLIARTGNANFAVIDIAQNPKALLGERASREQVASQRANRWTQPTPLTRRPFACRAQSPRCDDERDDKQKPRCRGLGLVSSTGHCGSLASARRPPEQFSEPQVDLPATLTVP